MTKKKALKPDQLDYDVYHATLRVRQRYLEACKTLKIFPKVLPQVQLMKRSVDGD